MQRQPKQAVAASGTLTRRPGAHRNSPACNPQSWRASTAHKQAQLVAQDDLSESSPGEHSAPSSPYDPLVALCTPPESRPGKAGASLLPHPALQRATQQLPALARTSSWGGSLPPQGHTPLGECEILASVTLLRCRAAASNVCARRRRWARANALARIKQKSCVANGANTLSIYTSRARPLLNAGGARRHRAATRVHLGRNWEPAGGAACLRGPSLALQVQAQARAASACTGHLRARAPRPR